jgi:hypothetical protein
MKKYFKKIYSAQGEKEKDITEYGSRRPAKNFLRDLKAFAKALRAELQWDPDIDEKGKDRTCRTNIAPIGGDSSIVLWKPESEIGVYININVDKFDGYNLQVSNAFMYRITTRKDKWTGFSNQWEKIENCTPPHMAEKIKTLAAFYEKKEDQSPSR